MGRGVKFSGRFKLAIAAMIVVTLGLKAIWTRDAIGPDAAFYVARAEGMLRAEGFATRRLTRPFATLLFGRKGRCAIMLAEYPPNGTFVAALQNHARGIGPLAFAWRGRLSFRPPKLVPLTLFYLRRELSRLGIATTREPITAIAVGRQCNGIEAMNWRALARLPR